MRFALTSLATGLALAALLAPPAGAQQVYRIVGPDGRVTFSDKPPQDTNTKATAQQVGGGSTQGGAGLPYELRQIASRYPVTLYTGNSCGPCGSARAYLSSRGVPFSEKTVTTNADIEALRRIAGASSLPFLTIGSQQLKGYSDAEWAAYLDAAGYPKSSTLPTSYRPPAPTPLVATQAPPPAAAAPAPAPAVAAPAPDASPGPTSDNPAGIRF